MDKLFYAPDIDKNSVLPEDESKHCTQVLRLKSGEKILITDGKGFTCEAILQDIKSGNCKVEVTNRRFQPPCFSEKIHIAVAPTKNIDRTEWFVEKATETGISKITFLRCQHSERKEINLNRIKKIAVSAMKQSQKTILPEISEMIEFKEFILQDWDGIKMIAHCEDIERQHIKKTYQKHTDAVILIGPEGDFSPKEIEMAVNKGYIPVSLGNSRLRTETAALMACYAIHIINA
ncbi:MAG: 16S rRNA (uracil(1498)-N(3))-methyltransferase [Tannerella sp.]|jgi:16S rRNA (uracil1498-N3)-methyltransferase|nr:16S rRNA (uracil(1498)-N(3))-methyltransferase [Tannerella sp.]